MDPLVASCDCPASMMESGASALVAILAKPAGCSHSLFRRKPRSASNRIVSGVGPAGDVRRSA